MTRNEADVRMTRTYARDPKRGRNPFGGDLNQGIYGTIPEFQIPLFLSKVCHKSEIRLK